MLTISTQYVKNQLERVPDRFTPLWKWRTVEEGKKCNGLEEGEAGPREMSKLKLAKRKNSATIGLVDLELTIATAQDFQFPIKSSL